MPPAGDEVTGFGVGVGSHTDPLVGRGGVSGRRGGIHAARSPVTKRAVVNNTTVAMRRYKSNVPGPRPAIPGAV